MIAIAPAQTRPTEAIRTQPNRSRSTHAAITIARITETSRSAATSDTGACFIAQRVMPYETAVHAPPSSAIFQFTRAADQSCFGPRVTRPVTSIPGAIRSSSQAR